MPSRKTGELTPALNEEEVAAREKEHDKRVDDHARMVEERTEEAKDDSEEGENAPEVSVPRSSKGEYYEKLFQGGN